MNKIFLALVLASLPLMAASDEIILDEATAKSVMAEISEASQNFDFEPLKKYVDSKSRFIWKTSIEGGKDGKEVSGPEWIEMMEFFASLSEESSGEFQSQIRSIQINSELNQATIIEDVTQTHPLGAVTYEERATETSILGVRDGTIKFIYWERNTTQFAEVE